MMRLTLKTMARIAILCLFAPLSSFAQSQQTTITALDETGMHPFGAYDGVKENISLTNGNLNVHLPLLVFPGRGLNFEIGVELDSKVWNPQFFPLINNAYREFWMKETRVPMITPDLRLSVPTLALTISSCQGLQSKHVDWLFIDPSGSKHHFGYIDTCGNALQPVDPDDSSLMRLDPTNSNDFIVRMKDGTSVHFAGGLGTLGSGGTPHVFSSIVDTNGNTIQSTITNGLLTAVTDTVGRVFSFDLTNHNIGYKDTNGTSRSITFSQLTDTNDGSMTFAHPLGNDCGGNITYTNPTGQVIGNETTWTVTIPNGATGLTYTLQFNVIGELRKITYPSGGYTKYDYQPYITPYSVPVTAINCTQVDFREVSAKHECRRADGNCGPSPAPTPEDTTTYTATIGNRANQFMDVLRPDPNGGPSNKTHYEFNIPNVAINDFASLELNRYIYSGSATLLRTIHTDYTQITVSGQPTYFDGSVPTRVTTTLNDISPNLISKIETDYDTATLVNKWNPYQTSFAISNPIEIREYDYGLTLKRKTDRTWLKTGAYGIAQKHILDRGLVTTIKDSANTQIAQTTDEYDVYTQGMTASGATQHQTMDSTRGNLTAVVRWLNTTGAQLTTRNQYDDAGNVRTITDPRGNSTTVSFTDSWLNSSCAPVTGQAAAYPTSRINALSQSTSMQYESCSGILAKLTDANLQSTTASHDALGRVLSIAYPDGGQVSKSYNDVPPISITKTTKISTTSNMVSTIVKDGLWREVQSKISDPQGPSFILADLTYNPTGLKSSVSNPYRTTSDATYGVTATQYDALGRVVKVIPPDGTATSNNVTSTYTGNCVTVTDQAAKSRKSCSDALGRLTSVSEDPAVLNYLTTYSYNTLDNLTSVIQSGSRSRTFTYNSLSQLLTATNPESGTITYTYDNSGNALTKVAPVGAASVTTTYSYDALNRLTGKTYSDGTTAPVGFLYDVSSANGVSIANPVGRLVRAARNTSGAGCAGIINSYDVMGRVNTQWQYNPVVCAGGHSGNAWILTHAYNLSGQEMSETNGEGITTNYSYDAAERMSQITSSLVDAQHPATLFTVDATNGYWPHGALRKGTFGNGLTQSNVYDKRLQPCLLDVANNSALLLLSCNDSTPSGNVLDLYTNYNLGVSDNGDIFGWNGTGTQSFVRTYSYDALNRLKTMADTVAAQACKGLSWTYDTWGNRTDQTVTSGSCGTFHNPVDANNRFTGAPYTYDAGGNMTHDASHSYTYDAENRIVSVDGGAVSYFYDAEGKRVLKTVGSTQTTYLYDLTGNVVAEDYGTGWGPGYVYSEGQLVAEYANGTTYFVHKDHLGSTRLVTKLDKSILDSMDYLPFGEQIAGAAGSTHKFSGKERDAESGLDNFGARYLGSSLGRFLSPDRKFVTKKTLVNPGDLNLYTYVVNNPITNIDPDGQDWRKAVSDLLEVIHVKFSAGIGAASHQEALGFGKKVSAQVKSTLDVSISQGVKVTTSVEATATGKVMGAEAGPQGSKPLSEMKMDPQGHVTMEGSGPAEGSLVKLPGGASSSTNGRTSELTVAGFEENVSVPIETPTGIPVVVPTPFTVGVSISVETEGLIKGIMDFFEPSQQPPPTPPPLPKVTSQPDTVVGPYWF